MPDVLDDREFARRLRVVGWVQRGLVIVKVLDDSEYHGQYAAIRGRYDNLLLVEAADGQDYVLAPGEYCTARPELQEAEGVVRRDVRCIKCRRYYPPTAELQCPYCGISVVAANALLYERKI